MEAMKDFILWCMATVPDVLLTPPISAFVGLAFLAVTIRLFKQMINL